MVNSYAEAVEWLHSRLKFGVKPGLDRMEWMLEKLGHPERRLKSIHIAGTNGKGSTLSFMRYILQEEGYQIGTFTSPYIERFNERISLNGQPISDQDFEETVKAIKPLVEEVEQTELGAPTEFEVLTVIAIYYFAKIAYPDIVIFETGLGGRLDSTNVIHPMVSVITNVGMDHMNVLGDSVEEIAREKAGIIKSGIPVISGAEQEEVVSIIEETASINRSKFYLLGKHFSINDYTVLEDGEKFSFTSPFNELKNISIRMKGFHQVKNAALALMVIEYLKRYFSLIVEDESIFNGLKHTNWMGRFEKVLDKPYVILDGAHNPEGIESLIQTVESHFKGKYHVRILFSALEDKRLDDMINQLNQIAFRVTYTTFEFPRAASAKTLFEASRFTNKHYRDNWKQAVGEEMDQMNENEVLIVCGSLYFISQVRAFLLDD